jgi:hypothetical protein
VLRQLPTLPFVGRQVELGAVFESVARAADGHGSVVSFYGDAGIGKTRLLEACAAEVPSSMVTPVITCGPAIGGLDSTALARRSATRAVVALVDDAHWATATQRLELARLAAATRSRRLVLVVAARGELPIDGAVATESPLAFRLPGLNDDAIALIARAVSAPRVISGDEIRSIVRGAAGNPRYALELAGAGAAGLARSACAVVAAARAVLDTKAFDVLSVCCVLGDTFDPAWLAGIAGTSRMQVAEALQRAQDLGILEDDPAVPGWVRFRYPAVRDACYASVASFRRRLLHERAASRLSRAKSVADEPGEARRFLTILGAQHAAVGARAAAARLLSSAGDAAMNAAQAVRGILRASPASARRSGARVGRGRTIRGDWMAALFRRRLRVCRRHARCCRDLRRLRGVCRRAASSAEQHAQASARAVRRSLNAARGASGALGSARAVESADRCSTGRQRSHGPPPCRGSIQ